LAFNPFSLISRVIRPATPIAAVPRPTTAPSPIARGDGSYALRPVAAGIPVISVDTLIDRHADLIREISYKLEFSPKDFDRLMMPVLQRFTAMVHLLPASEVHHHREVGGLLRHSLEVAYRSAAIAYDQIFNNHGFPQQKTAIEARWRVAATLAGLLHDIGKVVTDMQVFDETGREEWTPIRETILEWADSHNISLYFLRWRLDRHEAHKDVVPQCRNAIISPEMDNWLRSVGNGPFNAMMAALTGVEAEHDLDKIVAAADSVSIRWDRQQTGVTLGLLSPSVPVEQHLMEGMRTLILDGQWQCNVAGAQIWHIVDGDQTGLFVAWTSAAVELANFLVQGGVKGIPPAPDTLASILAECHQIELRITAAGVDNRWPVKPSIGNTERMIKIANPRQLYPVLPPPIAGTFVLRATTAGASEEQPMRNEVATPTNAEDGPPQFDEPPMEAYADEMNAGQPAELPPDKGPAQKPSPPRPAPASSKPASKGASVGHKSPPMGRCPECGHLARWVDGGYQCTGCGSCWSEQQVKEFERRTAAQTQGQAKAKSAAPPPSPVESAARDTLLKEGEAGLLVLTLCHETAIGKKALGDVLGQHEDEMWVVHNGLKEYARWNREPGQPDLSPRNITMLLDQPKWLLPNPHYPDRFVQDRGGKKVMVFNKTISSIIAVVLADLIARSEKGSQPGKIHDEVPPVTQTAVRPPTTVVETVVETAGEPMPEEVVPAFAASEEDAEDPPATEVTKATPTKKAPVTAKPAPRKKTALAPTTEPELADLNEEQRQMLSEFILWVRTRHMECMTEDGGTQTSVLIQAEFCKEAAYDMGKLIKVFRAAGAKSQGPLITLHWEP